MLPRQGRTVLVSRKCRLNGIVERKELINLLLDAAEELCKAIVGKQSRKAGFSQPLAAYYCRT